MINININNTDLIAMCELKVILNGKTIMEDVVRISIYNDTIKLQSLLGETMTIRGIIMDVNLIKQEALIESS
jgi:predicted RNA-binding protein